MYTVISVSKPSIYDYYFGITYLILFFALPILWSIYKIVFRANARLELDSEYITYKNIYKTEIIDISKIEGVKGRNKKGYPRFRGFDLKYKDTSGPEYTFKWSRIYLSYRDKMLLVADIEKLIKH